MLLQIADWLFDVNVGQTMAYSADIWENHCTCGYCRNFYETLDEAYPQLKNFLNQFGMNSLTPEEMSPVEPTLCMASYCISGTVVNRGRFPIDIGGVVLTVSPFEDPLYEPTCGKPFFVFNTGLLDLPWVLDEDQDEVISPANEPEYLQRMMDRLMGSSEMDEVFS